MDPETIATTWRIVIVCGTVFFCWLVGWLCYVELRKKQMMFEERRVAIENGITPPLLPPKYPSGWPGVKQRELELAAEERRLRIEKGLPVDSVAAPPKGRHDYLRRGIVSTCLGVGLATGYVALSASRLEIGGVGEALAWCLGLAPLFFLYGIANLIYQRYVPEAVPPEPARRGS